MLYGDQMLSREEIRRYLKSAPDLMPFRKVQKVEAFKGRGSQMVFIKEESTSYPFAIHPRFLANLLGTEIPGVETRGKLNFNTGYIEYPLNLSPGGKQEHSACDVKIRDISALEGLLEYIGAITPSISPDQADIEEAGESLSTLSP